MSLSWVLMDKNTLHIYNWDRLWPEDFLPKRTSKIYEAILQLDDKTIDVVTLWNQLEKIEI